MEDHYSNMPHIPGGPEYPARWAARAAAFRAGLGARAETGIAYGAHPREALDIFRPEGRSRGLAVFVHGGFWMAHDRSMWSHLAAGAVARGWTVALPSYVLAPKARVAAITGQVARAIALAAGRVPGPVRLAGHSAGGHLVCRMAMTGGAPGAAVGDGPPAAAADEPVPAAVADGPLPAAVASRVAGVLSISGLHDLRPFLANPMNATLGLTEAEAAAESPALDRPRAGTRLVAWVGGDERPAFLWQSELIAATWAAAGASTRLVVAPGRHHFDVCDDLADPASDLTRSFVED